MFSDVEYQHEFQHRSRATTFGIEGSSGGQILIRVEDNPYLRLKL